MCPLDRARALSTPLPTVAAGARARLGEDGIADGLGDGSAVLHPAVHLVDRPDSVQPRTELPFPLRGGGAQEPMGRHRPATRDARRVGTDARPGAAGPAAGGTHHRQSVHRRSPDPLDGAGVPDDGCLPDFLMRSKAVIGAS
ncbi:hypothetical protein GCM10010121_084810 [Streptomyces brasiliensis]|uniref:Uncharacterized protein n=1 Tax=Streptomyces brasiliensis TaxID=1954 RepID=A0A917P4H7_9ACTN|nr:hypothetical protein GCM10010121_084810 [Streptomyces brasiliensis]